MDDTTVEVHPHGDDDHALLAALASRLLGRPAAVTQLCSNCGGSDHGQPLVAGAFVSLSRAGDLVAIAASLAGAVGVDIETVERVAASGFDDVAFCAAERDAIAHAHNPDLLRARYWTTKEAVLKARGTGLRSDPRLVDASEPMDGVETSAPQPGYVLTVARLRAETTSRSTVR